MKQIGVTVTNARLPKKLYRVASLGGAPRKYAEKRGGTFSTLRNAQERVDSLRRKGCDAKIYVCYPEWELVDD